MIDLSAFEPFGITVLILLLLVIPVLGVTEFGFLMRWVRRGREDARIRFYRWAIGLEWVLTLALFAWWLGLGRGLEDLGLVPLAVQWQWLGVISGLLASFLLFLQMNMVLDSDEHLAKVRGSLGRLHPLAPHDNREQAVFFQLSITAGICEEILYRGFLMIVLSQAVGQWPALVLTALVFGLGHTYQGLEGVAKTSAVGLVFGLLALFSGSLVTGMVLHAVLDLTSGRIMQAAVNTWE